ncbi:MAG: hypothetical protein CMJ78_25430 [Planctomycetaceae bacterium]|nr:hypothetical protein [Planctomycetaceae bacterium]
MVQLKSTNNPDLHLDSFEPEEWVPFLPCGSEAANHEQKGLLLPNDAMDGIYYNAGQETYFNEELRSAFRGGGFPHWSNLLTDPDYFIVFEYRPDYENLLPKLTSGLIEF